MIYVITERDNQEYVKIGYTKTPGETVSRTAVRKRMGGLQVSTWRDLICIGACDGSRQIEKALHHRFGGYRITGEWFANRGEVALWLASVRLPAIIETPGRGEPLASHEERMRLHTYLQNAKQRAAHQLRQSRVLDPGSADPYTNATTWVWRGKTRPM